MQPIQDLNSDEEFYMDDQPDIKRRQDNFNASHLFGTKPWKSALYKKARSISRFAEESVLGRDQDTFYSSKLIWKNLIYSLLLGWIIALVYAVVGILLVILSFNSSPFISLVFNLSKYNLYPFKYRIQRIMPNRAANNNLITNSANSWDVTCYYFLTAILIYPLHLFSWLLCNSSVYYIPMAKLNTKLIQNLLKQPLLINIELVEDSTRLLSHSDNLQLYSRNSSILIASIHIAADVKYFKYTVDGVNIMFINLIPVVLFTLLDGFVLGPFYNWPPGVTSRLTVFVLCIFSTIPLSYFLGLGIASISAQTSFGLGAIVNASFGSIIEILLYCIALTNRKGKIVQGAFIGSFLAVLLLLPGLSMICGGLRYKELKFNVKSTGVTTTMLIMSIITLFTPTIFNISYGHDKFDRFYHLYVKPLTWICAIIMPIAYGIGLLFTLKTHVKHIYQLNYQVQTTDSVIPNVTLSATASSDDDTDIVGENNENTLLLPVNRKRARSTSVSIHVDLHDAPNWSILKSVLIIITCTFLFAFIAELLVDSVDAIASGNVSHKFIGVTLFAIVPSVPEFVNAVAFGLAGHVDLSLEIGLAYTVQVALLQMPCLVLFSALRLYIMGEKQDSLNSFVYFTLT
eukprot:NODE_356_length_10223_cov_0.363098.p1 type:complete len:628 gc:universal NODE_356_length_10223_cov_0.363098:5133-3250(-)